MARLLLGIRGEHPAERLRRQNAPRSQTSRSLIFAHPFSRCGRSIRPCRLRLFDLLKDKRPFERSLNTSPGAAYRNEAPSDTTLRILRRCIVSLELLTLITCEQYQGL
jgi:hypothetical protein